MSIRARSFFTLQEIRDHRTIPLELLISRAWCLGLFAKREMGEKAGRQSKIEMRTTLPEWIAVRLVLCRSGSASQGDLPLTAPVPGGVAIVCVGRLPARLRRWCSTASACWSRASGMSGNAVSDCRSACDPARQRAFRARGRENLRASRSRSAGRIYETQHVTLANRRQVEPEPERPSADRARPGIAGPGVRPSAMRRSTPSPSTCRRRVASPRVRTEALFFNDEPRQPHSGWISRLRREPRFAAPAAGTGSSSAIISSTGLTVISTTARDWSPCTTPEPHRLQRGHVARGERIGTVAKRPGDRGRICTGRSVSTTRRVDPALFLRAKSASRDYNRFCVPPRSGGASAWIRAGSSACE